jgi:hypothetical protein
MNDPQDAYDFAEDDFQEDALDPALLNKAELCLELAGLMLGHPHNQTWIEDQAVDLMHLPVPALRRLAIMTERELAALETASGAG